MTIHPSSPFRRVWELITSNKLTLAAMLLFAVAMGRATFVENDYGTATARQMYYDSWWFEVLLLILAINFIANIPKYKLFKKERLPIFLFHIAFLFILIGAWVTRYTGDEGIVRIRENSETSQYISQERYFTLTASKDGKNWGVKKQLNLTTQHQPDDQFTWNEAGVSLKVRLVKFIPDAVQGLIDGTTEDEVLEIVASYGEGRSSFYLSKGGNVFINGQEFTYNNAQEGAVNIRKSNDIFYIKAPNDYNYMVMSTQNQGRLSNGVEDSLRVRALYQSGVLSFVVSQVHTSKKLEYQTTTNKEEMGNAADLLFVEVSNSQKNKNIILASMDGVYSPLQEQGFQGYHLHLGYGPQLIDLPFSLFLKDFKLERYPGSTSPSAYSSDIIVKAESGNFPYTISMNHVLDHKGYRFFQASYDLDEEGTVLSVNRDYWGSRITYLGYFLMGLGMMWSLFDKKSRFRMVAGKLDKLKKAPFILLILLLTLPVFGQTRQVSKNNSQPVLTINKNHAQTFGQLMVQDMDGRIKPINTLSSEFLRKLSRKTSYTIEQNGKKIKLNPDQLFLSIHQNPIAWQYEPLIAIDPEKAGLILEKMGYSGRNALSFMDLLDEENNYRLSMAVEAAQRKKPAVRSETDNEIIKVDERFNILFQALSGNYLKIFPQPKSPENNWYNSNFTNAGFRTEDSVFVANILPVYFNDIQHAQVSGDWSEAENKLEYIKTFQDTMGQNVMPEKSRVEAEILYNRLNIFNRLFPVYWLIGSYMLILAIVKVFVKNSMINIMYSIGVFGIALASLLLTANMILRWYAGGYPPWSNGYEMIILVAWALFMFGFIFYTKSDFILPVVAIFGGTLLFVSFLDWLNPEITNLVPVLKSYWLKIHVAIIVSSYAPLALSALLGILSLVFISLQNSKFKKSIEELTCINELSMTIGLYMLAIGTFLGGVWANESWGRYWGWDPKETWALISIMVYAVVVHMRLVPKFKGNYIFNLSSIIAFFSIIMTSFGVNYYLSGLHSYAAGDPLPIPNFVYWVVTSIFTLAIFSGWRNKTSNKKEKLSKEEVMFFEN